MTNGSSFTAPASFAQQRLWFLEQFQPGTSIYNVPGAWRVRGPLDIPSLERSLQEVIHRHEVLRTTFATENGVAVQIVNDQSQPRITLTDLSQASDAEARSLKMVQEESELPFDLANGPLIRCGLIKLSEHDHILILTLHHVVSDLWSLGLLSKELRSLYGAFSRGQPSPLPELPIQYADFSVWQRDWLQGEVLEEQLGFWKRYLEGAAETVDLPTDRPRPKAATYAGAWMNFAFGPELSAKLRHLGQNLQVTQFMIMAAAFSVLLHRYSGQDDICIGYPVYSRNRPEIEDLIGFFLNTLVLRARLKGEQTFEMLLQQIRESVLDADAHQDLPFEKLVEELQPKRDVARHPLFQIGLAYVGVDYDSLTLPNLDLTWIQAERRTSKFELTLAISEALEGIEGGFEYNTDLFDRETITRFISNFKVLVAAAVANPQMRICDLPLLSEAERRQVLEEWNQTGSEIENSACMHEMFEEQARKTPAAVALVHERREVSYEELNRRANQLGHYLRGLGVGAEQVVGLCVERSVEMVVGVLGILKAGGAYLPLDPECPAERLAFMMENAGAFVVLSQSNLIEKLTLCRDAQIFSLDTEWELAAKFPDTNPYHTSHPLNLAYCIYTSGSSGEPKGVEVPHIALCNLVAWHQRYYHLTSSDRATQLAGVGFDASVWEMWPYLTVGASLYPVDEKVRQSPKLIIDWLAEKSISHCFLPTPLAELALAQTWPREIELKALLTGGDRLRRRPEKGTRFRVTNHYGPTETCVVATCGLVEVGDSVETQPSIGRPIANTQVYILDPRGYAVPIGVTGELFIRGVGVARGYLNEPGLTAASFVPNPFGEPGSRLYRTGDFARYMRSGEIEFLGRRDDQVKIRGFRIELAEIEAVLAKHPDVRECAVVAIEAPGEDAQLLACVVNRDEAKGDIQEWRRYLSAKLPKYMVPAGFVKLCQMPLLPNGKLDRGALADQRRVSVEPKPEGQGLSNALELALAEIWRELLKVDQVERDDDFFELGGQSLKVIQLVSRIRSTWRVELPLRTVFENPTIASMAREIEIQCKSAQEAPTSAQAEGVKRETGEI